MELRFSYRSAAAGLFVLILGWGPIGAVAAEPPEYFARLIDEGGVTFVFYDPIRQPRTHRGYTTFQFDVTYRSKYRYQWVERAGDRQLVIEPTISQVKCKLVNEVELPSTLNHDRRWTNSLVKHEFDHVAMTLDPRVRMLIEFLCKATPDIARTLPPSTQVTDELMDRLIHEVVDSRYQAVLKLLLANENDLDVHTRHGIRDLRDRRAYFGSLFTEPNLKQHRFPYLEEVKPLLRKKAYREAELPYDLGD